MTSPLPTSVLPLGVDHPDRRLFDGLIPTPRGTTYNAWLLRGSEASVLVDTVEPRFAPEWLARIRAVDPGNLRYVISHHAEQDHSGSLGVLLRERPDLEIVCSPRAERMLAEHVDLPEGTRIRPVADGETLSLGDRTLEFLHAPWVHWPETMLTWVREDRILFSCDLFGSHLGGDAGPASRVEGVMDEARRYYATIMMPFAAHIRKHLDRLGAWEPAYILPSHGPAWDEPRTILDATRAWAHGVPTSKVVLAWISMHESTGRMVEHLSRALDARGIRVDSFDLAEADLGRLAASLLDAPTLVLGAPMVLGGPHPSVTSTAQLLALLKPPIQNLGVIGSFGWGGRLAEPLQEIFEHPRIHPLPTVLARGVPRSEAFTALDALAEEIAGRHGLILPSP